MDSQLLLPRQPSPIRQSVVHPQPSHRSSNKRGIQSTAILPEQSLALVEIFLNAAIASVLYTRQLLKHDSTVFAQRCVADLLDSPVPINYEDFLSLNTQAGKTRSQIFKMLLKGQSRRADRILALLVGVQMICQIGTTDSRAGGWNL
jgi:HORMA domain